MCSAINGRPPSAIAPSCRARAPRHRISAASSGRRVKRIATAGGDRQSAPLSRVGRCNVLHFRGNLAEGEASWRALLTEATSEGFRTVQAQAEHGLGNTLDRRGQTEQGVPHLWRAYELYE